MEKLKKYHVQEKEIMKFEYTKKYLMDMASLRLDCRIKEINNERKEVANKEYYWEYGKLNKKKTKYNRLTNKEICPNNAPLIGQIRKGKVTEKNPHLFTPTTLIDIYNNCKLNPIESIIGLEKEEVARFRERNIMYKSYNEIFWGSSDEQFELRSFFPTAVILDILCEQYDENLWRIVLGYTPLNIEFEKLKISVGDVEKVYQILIKDYWELLMTGIFRTTEKFGIIGNSITDIFVLRIEEFIKFYNLNYPIKFEGENRLVKIENILTDFYNLTLKEKFEQFMHKYNSEIEYHSLETLVSIQKEMQRWQKAIINSGELDSLGINSDPQKDTFLTTLENKNKENPFVDDAKDLLYATRIIEIIENLFNEMTEFQSKYEDSDHWDGTYLGYVKKYRHGNEILDYFKNGNVEVIRPLIEEKMRYANAGLKRKSMYIKKHPDSWVAREKD